jgi:hypothetical protein
MDVSDVEALGVIAAHEAARELNRVIGGIVEDLDGEELARIVELGRRTKKSAKDVTLIVDGELHDDAGELTAREGRWMVEPARAATTIERDQYVAIQADERQQEKRDTVYDEGSTGDHLLDGGRKTERDWKRGRRNSHDKWT